MFNSAHGSLGVGGIDTWHDKEIKIRVSALFAQAESEDGETPKSRNVSDVGGGKTPRTGSAIFQEARLK
jgi:hypothetical protein